MLWLLRQWSGEEVFICGGADFMDLVGECLQELGAPAHRIHSERFTGRDQFPRHHLKSHIASRSNSRDSLSMSTGTRERYCLRAWSAQASTRPLDVEMACAECAAAESRLGKYAYATTPH